MDKPYVELSYFQVSLAALLIVINGTISVLLKLDLEHRLLIAAVCTIVQLLLIGLVLEWVFRLDRWYVVVAMMSAMTLIAGLAAIKRTAFRFPGIWARTVAATWVSSWLIASLALTVIVQVRPWYTPQYAIPLLGIVSLPGMMTGQLLAGTSPVEAVKYQIVIMFLIASGTALGTVSVVLLSFRRLFNKDHQFEAALLRTK